MLLVDYSPVNRCYVVRTELPSNSLNKEISKRFFGTTYLRDSKIYAFRTVKNNKELAELVESWFLLVNTLNLD